MTVNASKATADLTDGAVNVNLTWLFVSNVKPQQEES